MPVADNSEQVVQISLSELHPFKGYGSMPRGQPYQVRDDDPVMQQIAATVRERGVRQPGLVRPDPEGGYEIVAGHRRFRACELAGLGAMPVIVRGMSDEEAVAELVCSNIQRENVLHSERAWAYKMYLEAAKRQGARTDLTSPQIAAKFRSDDEVAKTLGISGDTLRRVASLTALVPTLLDMVDNKQVGVSTAYELTALRPEEQTMLLDAMDSEQATPSLSQAQRLKQFSQRGELDAAVMRAIMSEEKKEVERVTLKGDTLRKYFPASYTPKRMEETIIRLLEQWQKQQKRRRETER
ncbi:MAG TPA: ParB/RepB/Spo0J family partition protein [Candidatus Scatomorpha gallistercoris]|nr:ParB/RepB/Spo0J family partition protein [Candidatus Scatomorpha gallistercoris]